MPDPIDSTTPIIISDTAGTPRPPCPAGSHQVVCVFAEDLGEAVSNYPGNEPKIVGKVLIGWELAEVMEDGRPWMLSKEFTRSLHDKSKLGPFLANWRGKPFSQKERDGFNLRSLIGVNGIMSVIHKDRKAGGQRADVASVSPLMKGMESIKAVNVTLPDWIAERKERNRKEVEAFCAGGPSEDGPEPYSGPIGGEDSPPF